MTNDYANETHERLTTTESEVLGINLIICQKDFIHSLGSGIRVQKTIQGHIAYFQIQAA